MPQTKKFVALIVDILKDVSRRLPSESSRVSDLLPLTHLGHISQH